MILRAHYIANRMFLFIEENPNDFTNSKQSIWSTLFFCQSAVSLLPVVSSCQPKPKYLAIFKATLKTNESVNQQYPLILLLELQKMTTWHI